MQVQNTGRMETQMVKYAKPLQCMVPASKQNPTNVETNRKVPLYGQEDIQQIDTMPDRTCPHGRILQTICPNTGNQLLLRGRHPNPTTHHAGMQDSPTS